MSIWHALPLPWLSIQLTPSLIGGKIIQMVLGLILLLHSMTSKTWLKKALHFNFLRWNIRSSLFLQILLFYPILPTPRFKQLLFGGSYSKNPKNLKQRLWTSILKMQVSTPCHQSSVNYSTETYRLSIRHFFLNFLIVSAVGGWRYYFCAGCKSSFSSKC